MSILGLALLAVLAVFAVRWLLAQRPARKERDQIRALMLECDGDQELVERLIFAEMQRHEGIGFGEAARRARRRMNRDRR